MLSIAESKHYLEKLPKNVVTDPRLKRIHLDTLLALIDSAENGISREPYSSLMGRLNITRCPLQTRLRRIERVGYIRRVTAGPKIAIVLNLGGEKMEDNFSQFLSLFGGSLSSSKSEDAIRSLQPFTNDNIAMASGSENTTQSVQPSTRDSSNNISVINNTSLLLNNNNNLITTIHQQDHVLDGTGSLDGLKKNLPIIDNEPTSDFEEFLTGADQPKILRFGAKSFEKKIGAGDWEGITAKDVYNYFRSVYHKKYGQFYTLASIKSAAAFGMIKRGPFQKYGKKGTMQLVDDLIEYYEAAGLSTPSYPRPTLLSLSQDWIINKIMDKKELNTRSTSTPADNTKFGPYKPLGKDNAGDKFSKLERIHWAASMLAQYGYLESYDVTREYIEERSIPEWNRNNPDLAI